MWEEAGVKVSDIKYHSAQPWVRSALFLFRECKRNGLNQQPYPANLMVGFYATADSSAPIRMDLDNELEGAYSYFS
jgi:NAD+ diphosphatase